MFGIITKITLFRIMPHDIDKDIHPKDVTINGDDVSVAWSDGHQSKYSIDWLDQNVYPGKAGKQPLVPQVFWNKEILESSGRRDIDYNELLKEDNSELKVLLTNLLKYGMSFIKNVPVNFPGTVEAARRISILHENHMGATWEFENDLKRGCQSMTANPLGLHTDTSWISQPAGLQTLQCLYHDGEGGYNQLCDGFYAAEVLRQQDKEAFDFFAQTPIYHEYNDSQARVNSLDTVLRLQPVTQQVLQIRYKTIDRAPINTIPQDRMQEYYRAQRALAAIIEDPANAIEFKLYPGTAVIMDNTRVLHARSSFTGKRKMCGAYNTRDDWQSKARLLGLLH